MVRLFKYNKYAYYLKVKKMLGGGGSEKMYVRGGMRILWNFVGGGGHHKTGLFRGVISMHFCVLSYGHLRYRRYLKTEDR